MTNVSVSTSYISEKISKIRFCPEQFSDTTFVSGSAGMRQNSLKFWKIFKNDLIEEENEYVPKSTAFHEVNSDVTGLQFVDFNNFAATTADGQLHLIYVNRERDGNNLRQHFKLAGLHKSSCTVSVLDEDCVTVGEDGAINLVSCVSQRVVKNIKTADSTAISCCAFVSQKELLTGNSLGTVKVFNLTGESEKPVASLAVSHEDEKQFNRVTSICSHPTQPHIILAGTEEGSLTVFDLRQPNVPASYLSAHTDTINEVAFHHTEPSKLFTCAENGELWQWQQTTFPTINGFGGTVDLSTETPWLDGERAKNNVNVTALVNGGMAINSFDSFKTTVIAAGDNEALYLIEQLY